MWELMLCVFIKKTDFNYLHSRNSNSIPLGFAGYVGNKGGLCLQFSLYERTFCFINCHLTSGAETVEKRVQMIADILKKIQPKVTRTTHRIETDSLHDFHFILGDMNFRFNRTYTEHIAQLKQSADLIPKYDQLYEARIKSKRFPDYIEQPINFMPTYKRDDQSNTVYINKNE